MLVEYMIYVFNPNFSFWWDESNIHIPAASECSKWNFLEQREQVVFPHSSK